MTRARQTARRLETELDRILAAVRAGKDPALAAEQTRQIQAELAAAKTILVGWEQSHQRPERLTEQDVRRALTAAGGLMHVLNKADRIERAVLYRNLGLELRYEKDTSTGRKLVHARSKFFRSGGPISPLATTDAAVEVSAELVLGD